MKANSSKRNKVIAIVGPTASGKTDYAVQLAKELNGEIVSSDSRLVYKRFDIGTAKPTQYEMQGIKHHLIDIVEPTEDYSAGLYLKDAKVAINDIISRGKFPIVAGGTGLYFRVLLEDFDLPKVEPDFDLRNKLKLLSSEDLYQILLDMDKKAAEFIDKNDKKKLIRAIEVVKITGKPLAENQRKKESEYDVEWIGMNYPREILYDRINKRVDLMIEKGLIEETEKLLRKYGPIDNIIDTIGYKEIYSYLNKELELEEAVNLLKQNTRRYAKRQLTWFRKNSEIKWNYYPEKLNK